ncbi:MAG: hypothetical protein M0T77_14320 [Actinomycetota bacterium]|nr:hypothetical protein [Actinomycetota bacterium]
MVARRALREFAWQLAPGYMADRARSYEQALRLRLGIAEQATQWVQLNGRVVQAGPFAGMRLIVERLVEIDAPVARLLGVYEREIWAPFEAAVKREVPIFIDVGCADGYYAVGMPFASPSTTCYAYDLARSARDLCEATAAVNGVSNRVKVGSRFSERTLLSVDPVGALMLCDIEGAEADLFTPTLVRRLAEATVVIEIHEDIRPGLGMELTRRFTPTHRVETVNQAAMERSLAMNENRPPLLHWLVATPRGYEKGLS